MGAIDKNKFTNAMTYKEYATWEEGKRCEVLDGKIISMAPSPIPEHQDIAAQLTTEFAIYLRGKTCRVYPAPIDVFLFEDVKKKWIDDSVKNWVIPDLVVVCDPDKIQRSKIIGAPDLIIEIISPGSAKIDRMDKRVAYQKAGVKEYWIVDPANQTIEVYVLENSSYSLDNIYTREDSISVGVLDDLIIDLSNIFPKREI